MKHSAPTCFGSIASQGCSCADAATGHFRIRPAYIFTCKTGRVILSTTHHGVHHRIQQNHC
ncbi:hypothetical protein OESDEN_08171 [Oesophagostomum dentatum]|uniref:Uncharacterized protein n=1 Tax=Oesophagostomum dentatum TaxID=61180 RepID=A0A0B1SVA3_OESDE|nr:hypothetical protein OESDEN_11301 [Oesophagostomum dentatum]KHJ91949.1 hypothetical protein OESDEN_08171 [Oesophagostomum dentatum]